MRVVPVAPHTEVVYRVVTDVVRVDDCGDRIELWLEDITGADVVWDLPRFERAARSLGRWSGRTFGGTPGGVLRFLARGALELEVLIREAIIDAYTAGLTEEGHHVRRDDVAFGCDASMVVRSAFHSGPELTGCLAGVV